MGTAIEHTASDHRMPLGRNSRNCTYHAPRATSPANSIRPARESGVVLGSEIMKNENSSNAPLWSWWAGIDSGSPSHAARPTSTAAWAARKATVTSLRHAR